VNLATTSDARQTRSATRRPAHRARKERRHAAHVNHIISKEIVSVAQRTGRGIAVEALGGIRERVRLRRDQRGTLSSWPFHQLGQHLAYKAREAGVPFLEVGVTRDRPAVGSAVHGREGDSSGKSPASAEAIRRCGSASSCRACRWSVRPSISRA